MVCFAAVLSQHECLHAVWHPSTLDRNAAELAHPWQYDSHRLLSLCWLQREWQHTAGSWSSDHTDKIFARYCTTVPVRCLWFGCHGNIWKDTVWWCWHPDPQHASGPSSEASCIFFENNCSDVCVDDRPH